MRDTTPDPRRAFPKPRLHTRLYEQLVEQMMEAISELLGESRIESLSQPGRPRDSLAGQRGAEPITAGVSAAAALAMNGHMTMVSDVALLRDQP